jgi:2-methylisocitrate lyase-like PEP mutase family enzyme
VIEEAGFGAVYATGAGFANSSFGFPDVGLITLSEVVTHVQRLADAIDAPLLVDADDGYGGSLSVYRAVRELERAGAAAIQLEDQAAPKRCGHFDGKRLVSEGEMLEKLTAAGEARTDPELVIIARTDAYESEGFGGVVARAQSYAAAGADAVFVEAIPTKEELGALPSLIDVPLVANVVEGGKTPLVTADELEQMGYGVALYANTALRIAVQAVKEAMEVLRRDGSTERLLERMLPWEERQRLVYLPEMRALEERFAAAATHV